MYSEVESLIWFMAFIANSALKRSEIAKIILDILNRRDFLNRIKQEQTSDKDAKVIFEHFDSFVRLTEEVYRTKR
jgi:hypothetical protein